MAEDETNFQSRNFNPEVALASGRVTVTHPSVPVFSSVEEYVSAVRKSNSSLLLKLLNLPPVIESESDQDSLEDYDISTVLPDISRAEIIRSRAELAKKIAGPTAEGGAPRSNRRRIKNIFDRENAFKKGPLSILFKALRDHLRVRVLVRRMKSVRGVLTGLLKTFDHHLNLVLSDVEEIYSLEKHTTRWCRPGVVTAETRDPPGVVHLSKELDQVPSHMDNDSSISGYGGDGGMHSRGGDCKSTDDASAVPTGRGNIPSPDASGSLQEVVDSAELVMVQPQLSRLDLEECHRVFQSIRGTPHSIQNPPPGSIFFRRHVKALVVRGDSVVMVSIASSPVAISGAKQSELCSDGCDT